MQLLLTCFGWMMSLTCFMCSCHSLPAHENMIVIHTTEGDITAELYPGKAPRSVNAFLHFIEAGAYRESAFYRVVLQEGMTPETNTGLIQGGIWGNAAKQDRFTDTIEHESTRITGLSHTSGTLSLARQKPGTAGTEFFICVGDQTQFDHGNEINGDKEGFAAFGRVTDGMDVVRKIQQLPAQGEYLREKVIIHSIERL